MKKKNSILVDEQPIALKKVGVEAPKVEEKPIPNVDKQQIQHILKPKEKVEVPKVGFQRPTSISITKPNVVASPLPEFNKPEETKTVQDKAFSKDELEVAWLQFTETIEDQVRLKSFILSTKPTMISDTEFEIFVSNVMQEKEMQQNKPDMLAFIKSHLQNDQINMHIRLTEETETQRAVSPVDKYKIMAEKNPAIDILKNGLQLEID